MANADALQSAHPLRKRVYELLNSNSKEDYGVRVVNYFLITLIILNIVVVVFETMPSIESKYGKYFTTFDIFSVGVFTIEYILRVWSSVENPRYKGLKWARIRYIFSPMAMIDLLAILPFYLSFFMNIDLRVLRALRLLRIFKLTRYSSSMTMLLDVLQDEASVLLAGFFLLLILLVLAASGAYLFEHKVQPDNFGSIPEAMWWSLVTLTTVGYGDVVPMTTAGRIFGGLVTIIGVGMAALPAGILASGVADHLHRSREELRNLYRLALEDGIVDANEEEELEELRKELGLSAETALRIRRDIEMQAKIMHSANHIICPHCGHKLPTHRSINKVDNLEEH